MNNLQNNNTMQNQNNNIQSNPNNEKINQIDVTNNVNNNIDNNNNQANNNTNNVQHQLKNIATVDQNKEQFISNAQALSAQKKEHKTEEINYPLIIGLFVISLIAIIFLFPLLAKYI